MLPPPYDASNGPPLEATSRHSGSAANKPSIKLTDLDGVSMPAASFYKSMAMDIIEGHQIGLYNEDGSTKYPNHHSLIGGVATVECALAEHARQGGVAASGGGGGAATGSLNNSIVGIVRRRPASANPTGRRISPEAVRDVMKVSDIDGAHPTTFSRTRKESDNMTVSDLNQRKRQSPVLKRRTMSPSTGKPPSDTVAEEASVFTAYNAFHRYTAMHRPQDQGARTRPWSASLPGRAPFSDPLNPVYYVAAPRRSVSPPAKGVTGASSAIEDILQRNEQPTRMAAEAASARLLVATLEVRDGVAVSLPINNKGAHLARKGAGSYKAANQKDSAKILLMEECIADSGGAAAWNKLQEVSSVNHRLNNTEVLRAKQHAEREAEAYAHAGSHAADASSLEVFAPGVSQAAVDTPAASTVVAEGNASPFPKHLNPHMNYADVPYASSDWKLRLMESRSKRKIQQRVDEANRERDEAQALHDKQSRPRYVNPGCVDFGPSMCSTTTTQYTAYNKHHNDAMDVTATRGASPKQRAPLQPRRLPDGVAVGMEHCDDIDGATADPAWKRPATTSLLQRRIIRDVRTAEVIAKRMGGQTSVLLGASCGSSSRSPNKSQKVIVSRPSSATVRSVSTGAVPKDQQQQQRRVVVAESAEGPTLLRSATTAGSLLSSSSTHVPFNKHEISDYAAALKRSMVRPPVSSDRQHRPASQQGPARAIVRPPPHAANRKELLYRREIDSVRDLPNFV